MTQQPDKIFRDKLHGYEKPVSTEAWKRVSMKSNNGRVWLKIAAAILVLAVAGIFLFSIGFNHDPKLVTKTDSIEEETPVVSPEISEEKSPIADAERKDNIKEPAKQEVPPQPKAEKRKQRPSRASLSVPVEEEKPAIVEAITPLQNTGIAENAEAHVESQPVPDDTETEAKNITIVFSADEVNEKYLAKKESVEATSEEKESSTLKKVLDKAYDLTHNQDPMGDLRQKKNEILAMNFKIDKQRNEND